MDLRTDSGTAANGEELSSARIRVLVVEDNRGFAYFLNDVLTRQHQNEFEVQAVASVAEALAILDAGTIDVILLDLGLPDCGGFETFSRIQSHASQTPIIILTVLDDDETALRAMRAGAQDYLVKNEVEKTLLVRTIRYAIERSQVEEKLRRLSGRLLQLQDEERRRIARALHDLTAQNLAALSMTLTMLNAAIENPGHEIKALLADSLSYVSKCSAELRTMSYLLHPPLLDELGLADVMREYADGFATRSGIRVDLELPHELPRSDKDAETTLFRVMQESLANILQHSGSRTASIRAYVTDTDIGIDVKDAGKGIPAEQLEGMAGGGVGLGVGIAGMRERVRQLGGRLRIESGKNGTTVTASLPRRGVHA